MVVAVSAALLLLAQAAGAQVQGPPAQAAPAAPSPESAGPSEDCSRSTSETRDIVVCAQRPQTYRLDPDVMEAKRELRSPGSLSKPYAGAKTPCGTVGPAPCLSGGISPIAVVLTAAEMAKRLAQGKEIGSMFVTDPHPSEYQLYVMAKKRREALEQAKRDAKAAEKAKAAIAAQGAGGQTQVSSGAVPEPQHR